MIPCTFLSRRHDSKRIGVCALALAVAALAFPAAHAGDARTGVKAKHGEMVLLRNVPTRMATRQQPPGMALIVDPRPNKQINAALGTGGELSDSEIASLGASPRNSVSRMVNGTLTRALRVDNANTGNRGRTVSPDNAAPGNSPMGSAMGALGSATRGIDGQIHRALGALPLPTQSNGR